MFTLYSHTAHPKMNTRSTLMIGIILDTEKYLRSYILKSLY